MDTKQLGNFGEDLACGYLVEKGLNILGRNFKIKFGEVDIIAKKGKTIHFVEVKTIAGSDGFFPEQRADWKKQRKLRGLCQIWLEKNKLPQETPQQIDIIGIVVNHETRMAKLHYFPNAVGDK